MSNRMTALWLEKNTLSVSEQEIPKPESDEVLVRLNLAGICGTDLQMVQGYYSFTGVLGHEFTGEVVAAPEKSPWLGKRVVGEINLTCGDCYTCRAGRPTHCERRTVLGIVGRNGVFSEFFTLPAANLHLVPDNVDDEKAVFVEPLAAACQIVQQIKINKEDRVLVIGAGRLGQLIAQVLSLCTFNLVVAAKYRTQQERLQQNGIAATDVQEITDHSMDVVIEATGDPHGFEIAVKKVRPRGTIVLKSTYHGSLTQDFSEIVVNEITLIGSRCGPFEAALSLIKNDCVQLAPLVEARYPLQEGLAAFEHAARKEAQKVFLYPK